MGRTRHCGIRGAGSNGALFITAKKETIKTVKQKNEIILYLTDHTSAKSADIAMLLDVKSTRVKKLLSELIAEGVVVADSSNRNRTYKLKS